MKGLLSGSAEMVLTDVPYGVVSRPSGGLRNLDKGAADVVCFDLVEFLEECSRVCRGTVYVFCGTEQVSEVRGTLVGLGMTTRLCIWEKTNPSPMNGERMWLSGVECCVFGRKRGAKFHERCRNSVWRYPSVRSKIHPTQKSLDLFRYLVRVSSDPDDLVLDPCMGSGTTAVACEAEGRRYLGYELDPEFYRRSVDRVKEGGAVLRRQGEGV